MARHAARQVVDVGNGMNTIAKYVLPSEGGKNAGLSTWNQQVVNSKGRISITSRLEGKRG
jgi:hypothetical protein